MKNKTILLISPEPWSTIFVSKHHYAQILSENNTVYFLNPAHGFVRSPSKGMNIQVNKVNSRLFTIDYLNLLPRLNHLPHKIQKLTYRKQAQFLKNKIERQIDLVWSFDPYRYFDQHVWLADKSLSHKVDLHHGAKYEAKIIDTSNYFLSLSKHLTTRGASRNPDFITGHGLPLDQKLPYQHECLTNNKIKAVYVGNINALLAVNRIKKLAKRFSHVDFILAGPSQEGLFIKHQNIIPLGKVPSNKLYSLIEQCDVCLLPLKQRKFKEINSHKLFLYLETGKVILSDPLLDYGSTTLLEFAHSDREFEHKFGDIIENLRRYNSERMIQARKDFVKGKSYKDIIQQIEDLLL